MPVFVNNPYQEKLINQFDETYKDFNDQYLGKIDKLNQSAAIAFGDNGDFEQMLDDTTLNLAQTKETLNRVEQFKSK